MYPAFIYARSYDDRVLVSKLWCLGARMPIILPWGTRRNDVPIVYGLPSPELVAAEEKGDIFLGGCTGEDRTIGHKCAKCGARSFDLTYGWTKIISREQYEKDIPKPLSYSKGFGKEKMSINLAPDGKKTYSRMPS
jgi:hypothetical protein